MRDWPLNVFTVHDTADLLPIMRAIATSELHNLVFQADYRIIPAVTRPSMRPVSAPPQHGSINCSIIQMGRFSFGRIDSKEEPLTGYFAHN